MVTGLRAQWCIGIRTRSSPAAQEGLLKAIKSMLWYFMFHSSCPGFRWANSERDLCTHAWSFSRIAMESFDSRLVLLCFGELPRWGALSYMVFPVGRGCFSFRAPDLCFFFGYFKYVDIKKAKDGFGWYDSEAFLDQCFWAVVRNKIPHGRNSWQCRCSACV